MSAPFDVFASCAPGIAHLLAAELTALGAIDVKPVAAGVELRGHRKVLHRANLESGLASHVLVRVGSVHAERFGDLEAGVRALPWERFLHPGVPRAVRATAEKSRLHHTGAIAERVARSIAARLGDSVEDADDAVPVHVRFERDRALFSVDTSGAPLHRRGYRLATSKAPLREDLARALVVASGWDPTTPLVDPLAGGGTIAIEAAILAGGLAPGRLRSFALERTPMFHAPTWEALRGAAPRAAPVILASDRDPTAIEAAKENAARAGVTLELVAQSVSELDLAALLASPEGALVTNPPYGVRLGDRDALEPLYRALARRVRELPPAWRVALVTSERRLGMLVSPSLRTAFVTKRGTLAIRALVRAQ